MSGTTIARRLALGAAALGALALAPCAGAGPTATITISHQMRGCHAWSLGSGPIRPSLSVRMPPGTTLRFKNDDVMPQRLIQTAGPRLRLVHPNMNKMASTAWTKLTKKGVYRFTTRAGKYFPWAGSNDTAGKDYVLHLTVRVK
jgi:hypothetical protein